MTLRRRTLLQAGAAASLAGFAAAAAAQPRTKLRVEPNEALGFVFENEIKGGNIPKEFIPAIEKGVVEALEGGVLAGFSIASIVAV